ncbi:MAG: SpoIIE family protein phosphatase [Acidobacteriota bacterium]
MRPHFDYSARVRPCFGEAVSGDLAFVKADSRGLFAALVDVLGHGPEAHQVGRQVERLLERSWSPNLPEVADAMNTHLKGTRGAAAGIAWMERQSALVEFVGFGNVRIRRFGSQETRLSGRPGTLGEGRRTPRVERLQLHPGDVVLLYSDGVRDRFDITQYPQLLAHDPRAITANMISRFGKEFDDASCIAVKYKE